MTDMGADAVGLGLCVDVAHRDNRGMAELLQEAAELTARMAAGERQAIEVFYRRYFDWLFAEARRAVGRDEAFCLDVVHDAVLRIVRCIRAVSGEGELRRWLRIVVRTTAYDLLRAERRRERLLGEYRDVPAAEPRPAERIAWLRERIERLDPEIVRLIELRYERGWTLRRIAERLGLTTGAVDGRLRRALRTIRRQTEAEGHD